MCILDKLDDFETDFLTKERTLLRIHLTVKTFRTFLIGIHDGSCDRFLGLSHVRFKQRLVFLIISDTSGRIHKSQIAFFSFIGLCPLCEGNVLFNVNPLSAIRVH